MASSLAERSYKRRTEAAPGDFSHRALHGQAEILGDLDVERSPGILTVTGPFTSPSFTAALAAAQEEEPEAWVSPAPRSQIKMKISFGPVGTAS